VQHQRLRECATAIAGALDPSNLKLGHQWGVLVASAHAYRLFRCGEVGQLPPVASGHVFMNPGGLVFVTAFHLASLERGGAGGPACRLAARNGTWTESASAPFVASQDLCLAPSAAGRYGVTYFTLETEESVIDPRSTAAVVGFASTTVTVSPPRRSL